MSPGAKMVKRGAKGKEVKKEERKKQNLKFEGVKLAFPAVSFSNFPKISQFPKFLNYVHKN